MDYFDILKKAWNITWRYKVLWVLGFFAASGSSGGNGGGNSGYSGNSGSGDVNGLNGALSGVERWLYDNIVLVAVIVGVLVVIGLAFFILSVAAQGALVWGANEGAEDRAPSLRRAWGIGFHMWGRVFMVGLVIGLPIIVLAIVLAGMIVVGAGGVAALGDPAAAGTALGGGICCFLPVMTLVLIALSVVIAIVYQLAIRYAVLQNVTFGQAIMRGWEDLRSKRGAFVFFLVMMLPAIAFGFASLIFVLPFAVIMFPLVLAEQFVTAGAVLVLAVLVLMVPSAIYNTFASAAWTVFFRRMTGIEPSRAVYPSTGPNYVAPPAPPQAPTFSAAEPPIVYAAPAPAPAPQADAVPDDFWVPAPSATPDAPSAPPAPPVPPQPPADE